MKKENKYKKEKKKWVMPKISELSLENNKGSKKYFVKETFDQFGPIGPS